MPAPYVGGCACHDIRYRVTGEPLISYCCHCTECQRRTGSAFGMSMQVKTETLNLDKGVPATRTRIADSGNAITVNFCDKCGTVLFSIPAARPQLRVVYVGTLDNPGRVPVKLNIWTDSALPWVYMDPDIEKVPGQPNLANYIEL